MGRGRGTIIEKMSTVSMAPQRACFPRDESDHIPTVLVAIEECTKMKKAAAVPQMGSAGIYTTGRCWSSSTSVEAKIGASS